ncbi:pilus assembly protein [Paenibacillus methanolicus]|uniref:pilus assembly protein n=1 Tax=Paenibacillus methanolicus TaxID=582686 RepID=UPI0011E619F1|nr:pilus assembly protein [Paenibacillus methanolicus]
MKRNRDGMGNEAGGIVVEASLIAPIVMMAIVLFICLVRLAAVQMAVHGAASQVARQTAAGMYPVSLASAHAAQALPALPGGVQLPGMEQAGVALKEWLPAPVGPMLGAILQGNWQEAGNAAGSEVAKTALLPLLRQSADERVLDPGRMTISYVALPDFSGDSGSNVVIEAEYRFPLHMPFTRKNIILKERAVERGWLSDSTPAARVGDSDSEGTSTLQIASIEPDPLRPGRKATVTAVADPGTAVSVSVRYKSGASTAKHLGDATVGADGTVSWTWHVSGNTTPGVWELVVTAADGTRVARHFVVERKAADNE